MSNLQRTTPTKCNKPKPRNNTDPNTSIQAGSGQVNKPTRSISRKTNRSECDDSDDSTRKRMRAERDNFDHFKSEMREMLSSMFSTFTNKQNDRMKTIERQLSEVKSHTSPIVDIEKSLGLMSGQLTDMQNKIDKLEGDRKETKTQIIALEDKIDGIDRLARKTCIEIRGIPKQQGERKDDLFAMVEKLLVTLEVNYSPSDLRDVYRIPNKNNNSISTLIAEFSSTLLKGSVLSRAKKFNSGKDSAKLNTRHLGLDGPSTLLFLSENLTPKSRRLHYLARDLAKTQDFSFCWTSNGMIFLRKREGTPHILVKNEAQLEAIKKHA